MGFNVSNMLKIIDNTYVDLGTLISKSSDPNDCSNNISIQNEDDFDFKKKRILICHGMLSIRNYGFYIKLCTVLTLILYKHHSLFSLKML
ncbi:hypothetical protein KUTeg_012118 [Tegillarca granosa]|uniref:Uncharacterized protein n=1 Tax=Tegillarca granosa TaxID=220873 RepID=A0ABQ9EYM0_TEGGR|nr:hypothetical protein KUTeg_012118 [Tegillarca granosa]